MPGHGHALGYGASAVSLIAAAGLGVGRVTVSNRAISELAPSGSTIGSLSVVNGQGSYSFTVLVDPDDKFTIVGDQLRIDASLDYDAPDGKTSHQLTVRADNGQDDPIDTVITIDVLNAFEGPPFDALTLSVPKIVRGVEYVIDILGATPGSTIEGTVPDGMVLDGVARRITGIPTTSGESFSLIESGLDSQPRTSEPPIVVEDPDPLNTLTLPDEVSRGTTVSLLGITADSTFEPLITPPGWDLDPATGAFDIGAGAELEDQNWSVREIPSNPVLQPRVSSGTTRVVSSSPPLDFIGYGQSNFLFAITRTDNTLTPHPDTFVWDRATQQWATPVGNGIISFLNAMQAATGRVCRMVPGGNNATPVARLQKDSPTSPEFYADWLADIQASEADPAFLLPHQGENDAVAGTTGVTFQDQWDRIHGDIANDLGKTRADMPMVMAGLGSSTTSDNDEGIATINAALATINDRYQHAHFSHSNSLVDLTDNVHWTPASYGASWLRTAQTVQVLMGLQTTRPNWTLDEAGERVTETRTRVTLLHSLGDDFTPATGITGFEVSNDFGQTWNSAVGTRADGQTINLDHTDLGTVPRLVRYQYGQMPEISGAVVDNSSLAVPLQFTVGAITVPGEAADPILTYQGAQLRNAAAVQSGTIPIAGVTEDTLCVVAGGHRGNLQISSLRITAQPSGTVTIIDDSDPLQDDFKIRTPDGPRPFAFGAQAVIPAGTNAIDWVATYPDNTFGRGTYYAWTSPVSGLNSINPVDQDDAQEPASAFVTGSLATSAGGFNIVMALTRNASGTGELSGDETYVRRDARVVGPTSWVAGDAQSVAANPNSDVRATFEEADEMSLIALTYA